ncbi:hypothetical protein ACW95P_01350 [Candidatus Mycoplasma pogonae]
MSSNKEDNKYKCNYESWSDHEIILKYQVIVEKIAKIIVNKYYSLPITWEDLFVESLPSLIIYVRKYNSKNHDNIYIYLSIKLNYFMRNKCRKWLNKKHSVLNKAFSIDNDDIKIFKQYEKPRYFNAWNFLTEEQIEIVEEILISEKVSISVLAKNLKTTPYLIKKKLKEIRDVISSILD